MPTAMAAAAQAAGATLGLARSPHVADFVAASWIAMVLLAVRLVAEWTLLPILRSRCKGPDAEKTAFALFDNAFIAAFAGALEVYAVYLTVAENFGCTPLSPDTCIQGWPNHEIGMGQRMYMVLMFNYYLYEMLSTLMGFGTQLKFDMIVHHMATMSLISCSYTINLVRFGIMWQALFDFSNPLLHVAKIVHISEVPVLKDLMLPLFAVVFFVVRVAASPYAIVYPGLRDAPSVLAPLWAAVLIALMFFVCGLQVFWFYKIIQLARKGETKEPEEHEKKKK